MSIVLAGTNHIEDLGGIIQRDAHKKNIEAQQAEKMLDIEEDFVWERLLGSEQEKALSR